MKRPVWNQRINRVLALHHRIESAHYGRSSVDQAGRDGAHPDLLAEQPPRDLRDLLHTHQPIPTDVDALPVHTSVSTVSAR